MALLGDEYASSDEDTTTAPVAAPQRTFATSVVAAPDVSLDVWSYKSTDFESRINVV